MPWTTFQQKRLAEEKELLAYYFGDRMKWIDSDENTNIEVKMTTNSDQEYLLRLYLPHDFPHSLPDLVIRKSPKPMPNWGSSGPTHTLGSRDGYLKICYCRPTHWTSQRRLYDVFIKGLIWLEAYEGFLSTGKSLEHFLAYMPKRRTKTD